MYTCQFFHRPGFPPGLGSGDIPPSAANIYKNERSTDRPAEAKWFSLFGIPGRFEEPPVFPPRPSAGSMGFCTTGQRRVENIHSLYRSAASDSQGPTACWAFFIIVPETRRAEMEGGRGDGANVAWKIVCYEAILVLEPGVVRVRSYTYNTHTSTAQRRGPSMQNMAKA